MELENILGKKYQHYRTGKLYEVLGIARHSESYEELVVYKALYRCDKFGDNQLWVRPRKIFFEHIMDNGCSVPRFKPIGE